MLSALFVLAKELFAFTVGQSIYYETESLFKASDCFYFFPPRFYEYVRLLGATGYIAKEYNRKVTFY